MCVRARAYDELRLRVRCLTAPYPADTDRRCFPSRHVCARTLAAVADNLTMASVAASAGASGATGAMRRWLEALEVPGAPRVVLLCTLAAGVVLAVGLALLASAVRPRARSLRAVRAGRAARAARGSQETFYDPASRSGGKRTQFPTVFSPPSVSLSVIVPAYNEEQRLGDMLDEALRYLENRAFLSSSSPSSSSSPGFSYEIIVVDDGSTDSTVRVAHAYTDRYGADKVRVLQSRRNGGKGAAVKKGMLVARGRLLLMADADGATRFRDVEQLERKFDEIKAVRARGGGGAATAFASSSAVEAAARDASSKGSVDDDGAVGVVIGSRRHDALSTSSPLPSRGDAKKDDDLAELTRPMTTTTTVAAAAGSGGGSDDGDGGGGARNNDDDDGGRGDNHASSAASARRHWHRKVLGMGFNLVVSWLGGVHGLSDTQCGFKLYARESARTMFLTQHLTRWAFDVELLYVARRMRYPIAEVPVHWTEIPGSKVNVARAIVNMTSDLAAMRVRYLLGVWRVELG